MPCAPFGLLPLARADAGVLPGCSRGSGAVRRGRRGRGRNGAGCGWSRIRRHRCRRSSRGSSRLPPLTVVLPDVLRSAAAVVADVGAVVVGGEVAAPVAVVGHEYGGAAVV